RGSTGERQEKERDPPVGRRPGFHTDERPTGLPEPGTPPGAAPRTPPPPPPSPSPSPPQVEANRAEEPAGRRLGSGRFRRDGAGRTVLSQVRPGAAGHRRKTD